MSKMVTIAALILLSITGCKKKNETNKISICKVIEHEAINSVVSGIQSYLKKNKNLKYDIEAAQGSPLLASQIAAKFVGSKSNIIVAIGTLPAQCAFKYTKEGKTQLIFSSVTNPAVISKSFENFNTSGVSNFVDIEPQVELFKKNTAAIKKIGHNLQYRRS